MDRGQAIKTMGALILGAPAPLSPTPFQVGPGQLFDVHAFGAKGDGVADDHKAIQSAIDSANSSGGGTVWFARGRYRVNSTIVVPPVTDKTIVLRGDGMRDTYLYPGANGITGVRFGAGTPDPSGKTQSLTQYCGMEDMSVSGSLVNGGTSIGVEFVEMQKGWLRNVIIEAFNRERSIGLNLRGSLTSGGVGAVAAPHTWRCVFTNVVVATTVRPLVLKNCDENDFYSCNFSLPIGIGAGEDSLVAVDIVQGRNNRFYGLLVNGDRNVAYRRAYTGIRFRAPVNGDNLGHQFYGVVAEGFNHGFYIDSAVVRNLMVLGFNSSISAHAFWNGSDEGSVNNQRQNNVTMEMVSDTLYHRTHRSLWPEPVTFADGDTTPTVRGSDTYACHNTRHTTITDFADGRPGQVIFVRLDGNTTIAANANIHPVGNQNLVGTPNLMAGFAFIGSAWEQITVSKNG
jgi:Pectate lyase superfamily protein